MKTNMKRNTKDGVNPGMNRGVYAMPIRLAILLCVLTALVMGTKAEDKTVYTYEGRISGVFCSACSTKVKTALGKLPGVSSVKITATDELGVQALRVQSISPELTKEAAISVLGESAKEFAIHQFERKG